MEEKAMSMLEVAITLILVCLLIFIGTQMLDIGSKMGEGAYEHFENAFTNATYLDDGTGNLVNVGAYEHLHNIQIDKPTAKNIIRRESGNTPVVLITTTSGVSTQTSLWRSATVESDIATFIDAVGDVITVYITNDDNDTSILNFKGVIS